MARLVTAMAVVLSLSIAGCSSGSGGDDLPAPTPEAPAADGAQEPPQVALTDTLHLLDPPHMVGTLPLQGDVIRTRVPSDLEYVNSGSIDFATWSLPAPPITELRATASLVVDVQGVAAPYAYGVPSGTACFWHVVVHFEDADPMRDAISRWCRAEPAAVPTGVRTLEISFPIVDFPTDGDERIALSVYTSAVYGPDASVEILSGTPDADSTLTIEELRLPIDITTLSV
jgi:hypothetical protein